jgi:MYND finger
LDWNADQGCFTCLQNMMVFYEAVNEAVETKLQTDDAHKAMQKSCFIIMGLLSIAGFQSQGCDLLKMGHLCQKVIKPKYRSKKSALRAISKAIMAPNIGEYHEALFMCQIGFASVAIPYAWGTSLSIEEKQAQVMRNRKLQNKTNAREQIPKSLIDGTLVGIREFCDQCKETTEEPKFCPCRTVMYCSKNCQISHWKYHSKTCPSRKKNGKK